MHYIPRTPAANNLRLARQFINAFLVPWQQSCPSGVAAINEIIKDNEHHPIEEDLIDHLAFRTLDISNMGITSISKPFIDLGYEDAGEELQFLEKKVRARWFKPPHISLPRIFISELIVDETSPQVQEIILRYIDCHRSGDVLSKYGFMSGLFTTHTNTPPWSTLTREDFDTLGNESEYAQWAMTNGWLLNHPAISLHKLTPPEPNFPSSTAKCMHLLETVNSKLKERGLHLSSTGGEIKTSPDGLLLQSSLVADTRPYTFADGAVGMVPGSYIEFVERRVLPEHRHEIAPQEWHRRDGFEVGSADKIFESTSLKT